MLRSKIAFAIVGGRDEDVFVHGVLKKIITARSGHWRFWYEFLSNIENSSDVKRIVTHTAKESGKRLYFIGAVEAIFRGFHNLIGISSRNDAAKVKSHF